MSAGHARGGDMRTYRYGALALLAAAWFVVNTPSLSGAFERSGGNSVDPRFEVVPRHPPVNEDDRPSGRLVRRPVIVQTDEARQQIRDLFVRALLFGFAGFAGLGVLAYRIYGRRQGKPATNAPAAAAGPSAVSDDGEALGSARSRG